MEDVKRQRDKVDGRRERRPWLMTAELLNEWVDNQKLDLDYEGSLRQIWMRE